MPPERSFREVLLTFLKLGLTSFGGPTAHVGYFREEIVARRRWVDDAAYADLVALCQFLPGPASSQVGFSLGLIRAGYPGALAAWCGFTLPSAAFMVLCAEGARALQGPLGGGLIHGLKLVAVAIVAQAVVGMARTLCPDLARILIAGCAALLMLAGNSPLTQIATIGSGAIAGLWLCRAAVPATMLARVAPVSPRIGRLALGAFFALLAALPVLRRITGSPAIAVFDAFYRTGALVFGGGHVVLPLLRDAFVTPGWVGSDEFLAGYGAAQALPGPLFTFAAFLGALSPSPQGLAGAALGIAGIFLPGMLLILGAWPFWESLRRRTRMQSAMRGINAAVVGLLAAALIDPLWTTAVKSTGDAAFALGGWLLLSTARVPPLAIVVLGALYGIALR